MRRMPACSAAAAFLLILAGADAHARPMVLAAMGDGDGSHGDINLVVREVRVAPVRAHVGDAIRIGVVVEDHGDGRGTYVMRIYANGKQVAQRLSTYDDMDGPNALYRESFVWNTAGAKPGEYRIRAEAFVWSDSSPFDNEMTVGKPVTLVPAGAAFPARQPAGGEAAAVDPRWRGDPGPGRNAPGEAGIEREIGNGRTR